MDFNFGYRLYIDRYLKYDILRLTPCFESFFGPKYIRMSGVTCTKNVLNMSKMASDAFTSSKLFV